MEVENPAGGVGPGTLRYGDDEAGGRERYKQMGHVGKGGHRFERGPVAGTERTKGEKQRERAAARM